MNLCFIGFGEAGGAFASGISVAGNPAISAYDIKFDQPSTRDAVIGFCRVNGARACDTLEDALKSADVVFSTVTADQAQIAAAQAARQFPANAFFLDCNSCSPGSKSASAEVITAAGGRYVDVAVMAPVHPARHETPLLMSGEHAADASAVLTKLGMRPAVIDGPVGIASSNKMVRSIVVKGLEAITAECVLAGTRAGVLDAVLESLDKSYPGFDWRRRAGYNLERMMQHGPRRAAEMLEVDLADPEQAVNELLEAQV